MCYVYTKLKHDEVPGWTICTHLGVFEERYNQEKLNHPFVKNNEKDKEFKFFKCGDLGVYCVGIASTGGEIIVASKEYYKDKFILGFRPKQSINVGTITVDIKVNSEGVDTTCLQKTVDKQKDIINSLEKELDEVVEENKQIQKQKDSLESLFWRFIRGRCPKSHTCPNYSGVNISCEKCWQDYMRSYFQKEEDK